MKKMCDSKNLCDMPLTLAIDMDNFDETDG